MVSYDDLLRMFWEGHDPGARSWSTQYKAAVFYHNDEQKRRAEETRKRIEASGKTKVYTEILPSSTFYPAEAYHQKYGVRGRPEIMEAFRAVYGSDEDFVDSTVAARVNAYLSGFARFEDVREAVENMGLSPEAKDRLLRVIRKEVEGWGGAFCDHKG